MHVLLALTIHVKRYPRGAERDDLPSELELTAWTEDGLVMATQHRALPRFGVQFHPESILTPEGPRIVEHFLELA